MCARGRTRPLTATLTGQRAKGKGQPPALARRSHASYGEPRRSGPTTYPRRREGKETSRGRVHRQSSNNSSRASATVRTGTISKSGGVSLLETFAAGTTHRLK